MEDKYSFLKQHFNSIDKVSVNEGKGAQGIKYRNKMFAMFYKGDLTLQLPPERVLEIINNGVGLPHDPGTGKPMKNRVLIPFAKKQHWVALTEESMRYVMGI